MRKLGKAAIVKTIAFRERKSLLFEDKGQPTHGSSNIDDTWYWAFAKMLFEGVGRRNVESVFDNIAIVCFNYDRCIEHYLTNELMRAFSLQRQDAMTLLERLTIWHPYGTIGQLPSAKNVNGLSFGDNEATSGRCFELSSQISTFTEEHTDETITEAIKHQLVEAVRIVFLGFGFYEQNLQLIAPKLTTNAEWILATGYGLSGDAHAVVTKSLIDWNRGAGPKVEVTNFRCSDLLQHFRMKLTQ